MDAEQKRDTKKFKFKKRNIRYENERTVTGIIQFNYTVLLYNRETQGFIPHDAYYFSELNVT